MHDSHQVERQSIEQVISMVTASKTATAHKLLSVQEKMNIINMGGEVIQELCISMLCHLRIRDMVLRVYVKS